MRKRLFAACSLALAATFGAAHTALAFTTTSVDAETACAAEPSAPALEIMSEEDALQHLSAIGFITVNDKGSRSFHPEKLSGSSSADLAHIHDALTSSNKPSHRAEVFFFKLGSAAHSTPDEGACFVEKAMLVDTGQLVTDLKSLSNLIKKRPENTLAPKAMLTIAGRASGEQAMTFLQDVQAVIYVKSGTGYGVNPNEARFNKKRMDHLPNEVMKAFADNIKNDKAAGRAVVYQVKHMGHKNGLPE